MPAGRPKKQINTETFIEQVVQHQKNHLENYHHCFQCGWNEEAGAKLAVVVEQKLCQKCRAQYWDQESL